MEINKCIKKDDFHVDSFERFFFVDPVFTDSGNSSLVPIYNQLFINPRLHCLMIFRLYIKYANFYESTRDWKMERK